jgi:hypothetical protein
VFSFSVIFSSFGLFLGENLRMLRTLLLECDVNLETSIPTGLDFSVLVNLVPLILILGGIVAISKLLTLFVKGSAGKALKGLGVFGLLIGVLLIVTGAVVLVTQSSIVDVWVLLVLTGLALVLRPLSKVPVSALFGLAAGLVCAGLLFLYFPLPTMVLGISSFWIYLAAFLVPALIVYLIFKFIEDLARLFGLILGSIPVLTVLGFLCIIEGLLLFLLNQSLLSFFP